ncbi:hypothetical protein, partial [Haloquadratum walsbyi]
AGGTTTVRPDTRDDNETKLQVVAYKNDISLPIDRQNCVFCYPSLRHGIEMGTFETKGAGSLHTLFQHQGLIVINAEPFQDRLYVGEFDLFSAVIEFSYRDLGEYEKALAAYAKSLTPVAEFNSIQEIDAEFRNPEILFEGKIGADQIIEVIFRKEIFGSGYFASYPALPSE